MTIPKVYWSYTRSKVLTLEEIEGVKLGDLELEQWTPEQRRKLAYLVTETEVNSAHLREILQKYLPTYMVPMRFERVNALPRLRSGKVDRNALRQSPRRRDASAGRLAGEL